MFWRSRAAFLGMSSISVEPCGARTTRLLSHLEYHGLDIDYRPLAAASRLTAECGPASVHYHLGDALNPDDYPGLKFDVVVSTGLGEFLSDNELAMFYRYVYDVMQSGATFFTSATAGDARSDVLLRMAELVATYRGPAEVERILTDLPWKRIVMTQDVTGLQTFVTAVK